MLVDTKELKNSLKVAKNYANKKDQSDITANAFFIEENNHLILKASDYEIGISIDLGVVEDAANFDINLVALMDFISLCDDDYIQFKVDLDQVIVSFGSSVSTFNMFDIKQNDIEYYMNDELKRSSFAKVITNEIKIREDVFNAIDKNNPKYELNGMLIDLKNKKIVSTDTKRLSISDIDINYKGFVDEVIIPKDALKDVKTIKDIRISQNYVSFNDGNKKIISKQILGEFPRYERIVTKEFNFKVMIDGLDLKNNLKKIKYPDIQLNFVNNEVKIISDTTGATLTMPCYYPSDQEFKIALNKKLLSDSIITNEIQICFNDSNVPFTLMQNNGANKTIIMPFTASFYNYIDVIKSDFIKNSYEFSYKAPSKKRNNRQNKDKIIRDLKNEVLMLHEKLKTYEDKKSIVKNEIFNNIFNNAKVSGI